MVVSLFMDPPFERLLDDRWGGGARAHRPSWGLPMTSPLETIDGIVVPGGVRRRRLAFGVLIRRADGGRDHEGVPAMSSQEDGTTRESSNAPSPPAWLRGTIRNSIWSLMGAILIVLFLLWFANQARDLLRMLVLAQLIGVAVVLRPAGRRGRPVVPVDVPEAPRGRGVRADQAPGAQAREAAEARACSQIPHASRTSRTGGGRRRGYPSNAAPEVRAAGPLNQAADPARMIVVPSLTCGSHHSGAESFDGARWIGIGLVTDMSCGPHRSCGGQSAEVS